MNNKGFAFYESYWNAIQSLDIEQQKEVAYAIMKYGITNEMVDPAEMPIGYALTVSNQLSIDNSVDRWEANAQKATHKEDARISREVQIGELAAQGKKMSEIAELLGVSERTVGRSTAWLNRPKKLNKNIQGKLDKKVDKVDRSGQNEKVDKLDKVDKKLVDNVYDMSSQMSSFDF